MARTFGGHPTLQRFVEDACRLGCRADMSARQTPEGQAYTVLVIESASGAMLTIPDPVPTEHLSPSLVTNYQRRLGIKTQFAARPEQPDKDADE